MNYFICPYNGDSAMKLWPSLADKAFYLKSSARSEDRLFFYDTTPQDCGVKNKFPLGKQPEGVPPNTDLLNTMLSTAPVIVLIHGLGDEADSWRLVIPLLNSRGYRVLAVDLPGFGRSVTSGKKGIDSHATGVLRLIEAVTQTSRQNGKGVFLAGSSIGALVAEKIALKKPELACGLILIGGSIPGGPAIRSPLVLAKLLFSRKWYHAYRDNPEGAWASLRSYYADLESLPHEDKEFLKQRVMDRVESKSQGKAFFETQSSVIHTYLTASSGFARGISKYPGKILLLWGEKDRIMPLSSAELFKALRSDTKLEIIAGAGHLPQQEKPDETARLMVDFMDRVVD